VRWELRELWGFIGEWYARWRSGCGVVVMEQVPRSSRCDKGRGPSVVGDDGGVGCAAKGRGAVVVRMEAGHE
jgi:hypothetical protein